MKIMEILAFLFIFGLVMNGLSVLKVASTSYATSSGYEMDADTQLNLITTQIAVVIVIGIGTVIAAWVLLGNIPMMFGANIPFDKLFGYGLMAGLVTVSLFGTITTVWNIYEIMPAGTQLGGMVILSILLAIIGFLVTVGYVELTLGRDLL